MTRKKAVLSSISEKMINMYLMRVYQFAEVRISEELPSTSGLVLEAKLVSSGLRKRMEATTLEMLMFLVYNKDIWDVYTVEAVQS
ncbi:hypothetical protein PF004_g24801 [Phytophthora fragariae]|uniref:HAT C-terminal dimerisation domain-containing protein n=1 Tax=Phytophthora fragariae TaxID=53985 RepID=A0A6A3HTX9_9STRA|nr:hypothetical protein PF003_g40533 [Phytophthora fragariae]KAE8974186.1 hypothetical protein PF011_g24957 [Phytophthora fragariae]KAE9180568.1 hypothetical protein PF004_g24801 [Phytophthora fragariae]